MNVETAGNNLPITRNTFAGNKM